MSLYAEAVTFGDEVMFKIRPVKSCVLICGFNLFCCSIHGVHCSKLCVSSWVSSNIPSLTLCLRCIGGCCLMHVCAMGTKLPVMRHTLSLRTGLPLPQHGVTTIRGQCTCGWGVCICLCMYVCVACMRVCMRVNVKHPLAKYRPMDSTLIPFHFLCDRRFKTCRCIASMSWFPPVVCQDWE